MFETFMKKNCRRQRQIKKYLEKKNQSQEKEISCMSNGKAMMINLIGDWYKKTLYKNESIFS